MLRKLPATEERVETGAIQFGQDWPALHLRGDDAFVLRNAIRGILSEKSDEFTLELVRNYLSRVADMIEKEVIAKRESVT